MSLSPAGLNVVVDKKSKRYILQQPFVPQTIKLPPDLKNRLLQTELCFPFEFCNPVKVKRKIENFNSGLFGDKSSADCCSKLLHPLCKYLNERSPPQKNIPWRMDIEKEIYQYRADFFLKTLINSDIDAFVTEIIAIAELVNGGQSNEFRKRNVWTTRDNAGWGWQYPDSSGIERCIHELYCVLLTRSLGSALLEAIVAYVVLNWIHPFIDGNGRTSRIVFNILLQRADFSCNNFIPIREINFLARGGHEIRLRQTFATGQWEELCEYFLNVFLLQKILTQQEVPQNENVAH